MSGLRNITKGLPTAAELLVLARLFDDTVEGSTDELMECLYGRKDRQI